MITMIDNYDSFTYNLVQYLRQLGEEVYVVRNDKTDVASVLAMAPESIVISPGPGRPEDAGVTMDLIREASGKIPILGVCLGHQAIAHAFGGEIINAKRLMHGKTSMIEADGKTIFQGIKSPFQAMRYHSLVMNPDKIPYDIEVSAWSDDGEIMGIRHKTHVTEGIQFHPESIMTQVGKRILRRFLNLLREQK